MKSRELGKFDLLIDNAVDTVCLDTVVIRSGGGSVWKEPRVYAASLLGCWEGLDVPVPVPDPAGR